MGEVLHFIVYFRSMVLIDDADKEPICWQISGLFISEGLKLANEIESLAGNVRNSAFLDL